MKPIIPEDIEKLFGNLTKPPKQIRCPLCWVIDGHINGCVLIPKK